MPKHLNWSQRATDLSGIPWLTRDGALDPAKFPIEGLLRQALDQRNDTFRSACVMLRSMCVAGRIEAGVFLLGPLQFYRGDLERLAVVVENLAGFHTAPSAQALLNELRRVKSDNSTRRYITSVLHTLSYFPPELVERSLRALADDRSFSSKMRQKFNAVPEQLSRNRTEGA